MSIARYDIVRSSETSAEGFPTLYLHVASLSGLPHPRRSSYLLMVCPVGSSLHLNQKNCLELCWGLASWSCNPHNLFPVCIDCTALVFFVILSAVISLFLHGTSVCKLPNVAVCLSSQCDVVFDSVSVRRRRLCCFVPIECRPPYLSFVGVLSKVICTGTYVTFWGHKDPLSSVIVSLKGKGKSSP